MHLRIVMRACAIALIYKHLCTVVRACVAALMNHIVVWSEPDLSVISCECARRCLCHLFRLDYSCRLGYSVDYLSLLLSLC